MALYGLPCPPFIDVDGISNFRDIGGYAASPSISPSTTCPKSTRRGLIFRSADPGKITEEGKKKLASLGVRTVFDLRSLPEIERAGEEGVRSVEGILVDGRDGEETVKRVFAPAFKVEDYSPEKLAVRFSAYTSGGTERFTTAYTNILHSAGPSYRLILLHLLHPPTHPLLIHCSAGKDRTGLIVAIILALAGCDKITIAREYALTELGLGPRKEVMIKHLLEMDSCRGDRGKAESMISAKEEYMIATLEMMEKEFGGVEGYVKQCCGLNDEEIQGIREVVTVDAAPVL